MLDLSDRRTEKARTEHAAATKELPFRRGDVLFHSIHGLCVVKGVVGKPGGLEGLSYWIEPVRPAKHLSRYFVGVHQAIQSGFHRPISEKEMKDIHFCFAFAHDPGTFHSHKKILLPTDIKGMKVRPATATIGQMITLLGGTNVQASAPESRDMLERGVAEAITFPWGSLSLFGIDKVVKYHMDTPLYVTPFIWAMNKDKYDAMSPTQKKAVDSHCTSEWAEKVGSAWADFEISGRTKLAADPNREVYKLTPEQLSAWKQATQPLEKQWAEDVKKRGEDPVALMSSLRQTLTKYKALLQ